MTADDLARSVAKDLAPELGNDLPAKTEIAIKGESTRGWQHAVEISTIVVHVASLAWDIYKETRDLPRVREMLSREIPDSITAHNAKLISNSIVENLEKEKT